LRASIVEKHIFFLFVEIGSKRNFRRKNFEIDVVNNKVSKYVKKPFHNFSVRLLLIQVQLNERKLYRQFLGIFFSGLECFGHSYVYDAQFMILKSGHTIPTY